MNKEATALRQKAAKALGNECEICSKTFGKGFTFHHLRYRKGEKIYSDFKNSDEYNIYICPIIMRRPKDFMILCQGHHHAVEQLKRYKKDKFNRLVRVVRNSN